MPDSVSVDGEAAIKAAQDELTGGNKKKGKDGKPLKPSQAIKQRQKAKAAAKGPSEVDEVTRT